MSDLVTRFKRCRYCGRRGGSPCGASADERGEHKPIRMTAEQWATADALLGAFARLGAAMLEKRS